MSTQAPTIIPSPPHHQPLLIGLVANEPSGDLLGAALAQAIRAHCPTVRFIGVAGPHMRAAGCETLFDQERLSVMGLIEVLPHLPELFRRRRQLRDYFITHPPAVFIGIDAPDFNLPLEHQLRKHGIKTVHVVSPTVWAWRAGRVKTLRRAVDRLLCLFPFEETFLRQHAVPATYVGHPLADAIPLHIDQAAARIELGLDPNAPTIAVLPGSRVSEMQRLAAPFIATAYYCRQARPALQFVVPLVNARLRALFEAEWQRQAIDWPITLIDGRSHTVIAAADVVLTASGTATLETLLLKRPMVVAYRLHPLTYWLFTRLKLVKTPAVALANLLAVQQLAPEFLQNAAQPKQMAAALLAYFDDPERVAAIQAEYARIHSTLRCSAADRAAQTILELIAPNKV
ncbi:lipid-A-disaccharide synthase [Allochromatium warmingii]|uniref:Lipid-A-disaccharide synthase n=1 Tax=Allochromatium warmingii TaxID=61595 RepID=A0A1H3GCH4_ALLWA|nr:lipid-A-disaccharide synthase [Allochromatium warmingii]SDY00755.1 lipid-A-disaccharide synthase [Allochromatium warmingii]